MAASPTVVLIPGNPSTLPQALFRASKAGAKLLQFSPDRIEAIFNPNRRHFWDIQNELGGSKAAFGALLIYPPSAKFFREPRVDDDDAKWTFTQESMLSLDSAERRLGKSGIIMVRDVGILCKLEGLITTEHADFAHGPVHAVYNFLQATNYGVLDANGVPVKPLPNLEAYLPEQLVWFERPAEGGMGVLACSFSIEYKQYEINATGRLSDQFVMPLEFGLDSLGRRLEKFGKEGRQLLETLLDAASSVHSNFIIVGGEISGRIMRLLSEGEERGFANADVLEPRPKPRPTLTWTKEQTPPTKDEFRNIPSEPSRVVVGPESGTYSLRVGN